MQLSERLKSSSFIQAALVLLLGNLSARLIPLILAPLVTRIYSPEDFGGLALFISITSIFSVFISSRYEMSILLPSKNSEAEDSLNLVFFLSLSLVLLTTILLVPGTELLSKFFTLKKNQEFIVYIPVCSWFICNIKALNLFSNRNSNYRRISVSTILQSFTTPIMQLAYSLLLVRGGLIFGAITGYFVSFIYLFVFTKRSFSRVGRFNLEKIKKAAIRFKKFPTISLLGAVFDTMTVELPIFFITKAYGSEVTGWFSFTFRIVNLPMVMMSNSLMQVTLRKITEVSRDAPRELPGVVSKVGGALFIFTIPIVLFLSFFGEKSFSFIFGEEWRQAGEISGALVFVAAIRFVVSPLSGVLVIEKNLVKGVLWKSLYFLTSCLMLFLATKLDFYKFIKVFVLHEAVLYGVYLFVIVKSSTYKGE